MDYNTSRPKITVPEYGRNVQHLIDKIKLIETKEERTKAAFAVIQVMKNMNPGVKDTTDFQHKLWDHLTIISDFDLDIDAPFELPTREKIYDKPAKLDYYESKVKVKHYGKTLQLLIEKVSEWEDGPEREELIRVICNQMKKNYLMWNRESITDSIIFKDLKYLSKGRLIPKEHIVLLDTQEILVKVRKRKKRMEAEKKPSKYNKERRTDKVISVEKVIDITNGNSEKKAENAM
jgi:hypothetical protein